MSNGKRMPDGSVCWTGSSCRRHGAYFTKNPLKKLAQTKELNKEPQTPKEKFEAEYRNHINKIYSHIYDNLLKTGELKYEEEDFQNSRNIRRGLNGDDKTKLNQLDGEAIQVRMEMTQEEKDTLSHYQSSYEFVNAYLRNGREGINSLTYLQRSSPHPTKPNTVSDETLDRYEEMAKERILKLDDTLTIHSRKNTNNQILYRAFFLTEEAGTSHLTPQEYVETHYPIGKTIEDKGYMSTTNDSDYMLNYNPHLYEKQIVFEIKTSKGTVLHNPAESSGSIGASERETLLPRGMKYKVINITKAKYQTTYNDEDIQKAKRRNSKIQKQQMFTVVQLEEIN